MSGGQCLTQLSEQCSSSTQQSPCDVWCGHRLLNIQTSHVLHLLKASIKHIKQSNNIQYTLSINIQYHNGMVIGDH